MSSKHLQSLLFAKSYWTQGQARRWLAKHGFKHSKVHETQKYFRFRQHALIDGASYKTLAYRKCREHAECDVRGIKMILETT